MTVQFIPNVFLTQTQRRGAFWMLLMSSCLFSGLDVDQNGMETTMGDDSDSTGKGKPNLTTPPAREKRKPFFKKQASEVCVVSFYFLYFPESVSCVLDSVVVMNGKLEVGFT